MIKDKYISAISLVSMILVIALMAGAVFSPAESTDLKSSLNEPAYMTRLFDTNKVNTINIQMSEEEWNELLENATDEEYYPANIVINGEVFKNVGIRAKGNSSLSMVSGIQEGSAGFNRYSFKIKLDEYITAQNYHGLTKFTLNNNMSDATSMKEYLSYSMFKEMDIATPGFAYSNISINDENWGLYLAVEVLEEEFVERNYGSLDGNLYKPESMNMGGMNMGGMSGFDFNPGNMQMPEGMEFPGGMQMPQGMELPEGIQIPQGNERTEGNENPQSNRMPGNMGNFAGGFGGRGSTGTNLVYTDDNISSYSGIFDNSVFKKTTESDYKKVIEMMKSLSTGENIEEHINVDEVLRYIAVNTFVVNLDSYAGSMKHNYYLYEEDGVFEILPWDYNLAFGAHEVSESSKVINFPIDEPVSDTMENTPLISKLLEVDEYKEKYHNYLQELINQYIISVKYEEEINKVDSLISEYIKIDETAFFTYDEYKNSLATLKQYGIDRAKSIIAQINGEQPSDTYGNMATTVNISLLGQGFGRGGGDRFGRGQQTQENQTESQVGNTTEEPNNSNQGQISPQEPVEGQEMPSGMTPPSFGEGQEMPSGMTPPNFGEGQEMPSGMMPPSFGEGQEIPSGMTPPSFGEGQEMPSRMMPPSFGEGQQIPGGKTGQNRRQQPSSNTEIPNNSTENKGNLPIGEGLSTTVEAEQNQSNTNENRQNRMTENGNRQNSFSRQNINGSTNINMQNIYMFIGLIVIMFLALIFVSKFKRKHI